MGVRFGRIYDCGKCNNENPFDSHTISNILFFIIGKSIIEEKIKKISQHRGKRNLKCALYK